MTAEQVLTMEEKPLNIVQSGGDSLIQHAPIFSSDGKLLFCACTSEVKVFSTETGECAQRLIGHEDEVTGIAIHPNTKLQVITSSLDGTLRTWDYEDGILLKSCKIGYPLSGVYTDANNKAYMLVVTKDRNIGNLLRMPIAKMTSGDVTNDPELVFLAKGISIKMAKAAGFLLNGKYAVFCKDKSKICVQNITNKKYYTEHENKKDGKITCFSCHPTENCFATGHTSGIIKFWHNVCPKKEKAAKVVVSHVHWHRTFVQDIAFTPGGSSLLSVGGESVLVQWQYRKHGDQKNVLPRLGGQARHIAISSDSTLYATTLRDNAALIITSNFKIKHTIEGFTAAHDLLSVDAKVKMFEYDWQTRSCATIGKPGHLLFYKPHDDVQLYNLDITHRNYISGDSASKDLQSIITGVAFSQGSKVGDSKDDASHSTWMATIEEVASDSLVQDRKLKFWVFDKTQQWWKLNTVINDPHKSNVTRIVFRPNSDTRGAVLSLLTTGLDGVAKIWEMENGSGKDSTVFWSCIDAATHRQQKALDGCFSQDGSLAAVAFGHTVCASDPDDFHNMSLLFSFTKDDVIKRLLFGRHSCQHILLMLLEDSVHSFDLLTGNISWTVNLTVDHIFQDPLSDVMGAISDSNDLYIFKPSGSLPLYVHKNVSKNNILSASFVPNVKNHNSWLGNGSEVPWMRSSRLFFVDRKMSVFTICTDAELEVKHSMSTVLGSLASDAESLKTPLASVLLKSTHEEDDFDQEKKTVKELNRQAQLAALKKITDIPCHVMPPMKALCKDFVLAFLPQKPQSQTQDDEVEMEADVDEKQMNEARERSSGVLQLEELLSKVDINKIKNMDYDCMADLW